MAEVRFYHLQRRTMEQALPKLLEKTLERGWRALVRAGSRERVDALNQHLWTYDAGSFLPHGTARDGFADAQPVYLTDGAENPNGATVLFLVDGAGGEGLGTFDLVCDLFDGNDSGAVAAARERWRACKAEGHGITYWQENDRGAWEKKA